MPWHSGGVAWPHSFFSSARAHAAFFAALSDATAVLREVSLQAFETAVQRSFASGLQLVAWHTAPAHRSHSHRSLYESGLTAIELDNQKDATSVRTMAGPHRSR
jgi:hypothetical protein